MFNILVFQDVRSQTKLTSYKKKFNWQKQKYGNPITTQLPNKMVTPNRTKPSFRYKHIDTQNRPELVLLFSVLQFFFLFLQQITWESYHRPSSATFDPLFFFFWTFQISQIILAFIATSTKLVLQIFYLTSLADHFQYPDIKFKKNRGSLAFFAHFTHFAHMRRRMRVAR